MFPDTDHKDLYGHVGITLTKEPIVRIVNGRNTEIAGIPVRLLRKGTCLEFKSDSASVGSKNFTALENELLQTGTKITNEITERCEKEKCRIKQK